LRIEEHPIIDFKRGNPVKFTFNGLEISAYEGETIAAALHAAGVRVLSHSHNLQRPRGFFCAIGNCSSCLMKVNEAFNVRICVTPVREGDRVEMQEGRGDIIAKA